MKKILFAIFSVIMLTSCSNQTMTGGLNENDSLCVNDTVVTLDAKQNFSVEFKTYAKNTLFKADTKTKDLYHENSISIQWPVKAEGLNIKLLCAALAHLIDAGDMTDPQAYVDQWANEVHVDHGWDISYTMIDQEQTEEDTTEELPEQENGEAGDDEFDELAMQYDTRYSISLNCSGTDSVNHLITFVHDFAEDNGCGLGSCVYFGFYYLVYDYMNNRVVEITDLIADEEEALKQLREQAITEGEDDYDLEGVTELPQNFFIDGNNIVFQFDKYEISYGAAGCPTVGFDATVAPNALTEYGKQVFGIKK